MRLSGERIGAGCSGGGVEAMTEGRQQEGCCTMGEEASPSLFIVKGSLAMFVEPKTERATWIEGVGPFPRIARVTNKGTVTRR